MKIAMIGHKRFPSREGGVEVAVEALATRIAARGHEVTLYNRGSMPRKKRRKIPGIRVHSVPVINKGGIAAVMGSFFATLHALFCRYDCIHYHAEGPAAWVWLPRLFGIRTIVTIHGLDWQRSKWGRFASRYLRLGERTAAAHADEIIVLSRAMQQYFLDTYGRETVYIPNGAPQPSAVHARRESREAPYILYLGRLVPEKGVQYLIEAFRQVDTGMDLIIAGKADSPEFEALLKKAAAGDDRIRFTGFVEGEPLEALYAGCYLYCLPSELEGMPISLLEAMSHGCCCVSSDIPECAEVLGSCGYLFESKNPEALRSVLQLLCDRPDLAAKCRWKIREHIATRPTWDDVTRQTLALYCAE